MDKIHTKLLGDMNQEEKEKILIKSFIEKMIDKLASQNDDISAMMNGNSKKIEEYERNNKQLKNKMDQNCKEIQELTKKLNNLQDLKMDDFIDSKDLLDFSAEDYSLKR